jgi:thiol-disulfide isomerase/thioredoxin
VLASALTLIQCSSEKEEIPVISGVISGLSDTYMVVYQVADLSSPNQDVVDTIWVNEKGAFKYAKALPTAIYSLKYAEAKNLTLALVEGQYVQINGENIESVTITGSVDTDLLKAYETFRKESLTRLVYTVRNQIKTLLGENEAEEEITKLRSLEVVNYGLHLDELAHYIQQNMGTSIAIYPTSIRWNTAGFETYNEIVTAFKAKHPHSDMAKKLTDKITILGKTAVGNTVANIEMPAVDGKLISLESVKEKYTIIDFWASWCPPCRSESVGLSELYKSYHSKGLAIYGISLDTRKKRWLAALEKDRRVWPNVSTLEGLQTPAAKEFGVSALPTNLIIDENGKIIASNIHGAQLKAFIEDLF